MGEQHDMRREYEFCALAVFAVLGSLERDCLDARSARISWCCGLSLRSVGRRPKVSHAALLLRSSRGS